VEGVVTRAVVGRHAQALRKALGQQHVQRGLAAGAVGDREQFPADNGNDAALLDCPASRCSLKTGAVLVTVW
jgi:hypothetical protein